MHPHPTNRPHLTVLTAASLAGLPPLLLPVTAELGEVEMLGRALVRRVTPTAELREIHAGAWSALAGAQAWPAPPEWIPHVSLALKVPEAQREAALKLFSQEPVERGHFTAARSYDTASRTVRQIRGHVQ